MYKSFELVICVDKNGYKKEVLERGTLEELYKITTKYENSEEIRSDYEYLEKIEEFQEKYGKYMTELTDKNSKIEKGDITIIDPEISESNKKLEKSKQKNPRKKIIYKPQIEELKIIKEDKQFEQYLKNNYYREYCIIQICIQIFKTDKLNLNEELVWGIFEIIRIYRLYAKQNNKLSPEAIYNHIKKTKQILQAYQMLYENEVLDNYQGIYDESNNEPTEPEKLEAYEIDFIAEHRDEKKYDIQPNKVKKYKKQWGK